MLVKRGGDISGLSFHDQYATFLPFIQSQPTVFKTGSERSNRAIIVKGTNLYTCT